MLRGFYIASNGLINQQRTINTISNNVANSQTPGYKSDTSVQNTFKKELLLLNGGRINKTGTIEYKYTEQSFTGLSQGSLEFTERPLDFAIEGPVFFNIQSGTGDRLLSRNGQFSLDDEGYLFLNGAGRVLGENGEIFIGKSDFSVSNSGEIFIDGQQADKLELTYIEEEANIQKSGDNTFTLIDGANGEVPADLKYSIIQGAFERANVDVAIEMTRAMSAQRSFEAMSKPQNEEAQTGHGVKITKTDLMYEPGQLLITNRELDFATPTDGFFAVSDETGDTSFTKDGAFYMSQNGESWELVNSSGKKVLGYDGNPITLSFGDDGKLDLESLTQSIGVFTFENPFGLLASGSNSYQQTASSGEATADIGAVKIPGALELSTVDLAEQMIKVIQYQRAFQLNSKMVQTSDEIQSIENN